MANTREIQSRMKSIKDTMKITNAMYMISSNKVKKAKKSLEDTEPYFYTLQSTISRILRHVPDMHHVYFDAHGTPENERKRGYLVITADKGMAGSYNHNVLKKATEEITTHPDAKLYVVGELGRQHFEHKQIHVDEQIHYTAQNPTLHRARLISGMLLEEYEEGRLDEVYVIYTKMVNNVECEVEMEKILPLSRSDYNIVYIPTDIYQEEFFLLPSPEEVFNHIVPNYIMGFIYGALTESFCAEQNARMMAMDAATKSAEELLHELSILYNRVRQAQITQEITEVCSGARAQKNKK